ncbi:unnamed protein product [Schistosoma curassoni]|uniref:DDE_Tnp_1_7 domain-containing protein n=1 Tax=Schistosoma curassoni TaxID=6186 RepID=A0A183JFD3_9TREM|nr:unnamed protein product [Schistosoma curassoni]
MIWKKTKKVGFGFTKSEIGNIIFVVGHYLPAGNKTTEFQDNVLPRREGENFHNMIRRDFQNFTTLLSYPNPMHAQDHADNNSLKSCNSDYKRAHDMKTDDDCSNDPNDNLKEPRHSCSKGRCVII